MENLSHSRTRNRPATSSLPKKHSNGNGRFKTTNNSTAYDDVFGGPPRFVTPRLDDYLEIFSGRAAVSSIPVLDLPIVDDREIYFDVRSHGLDYREVFGGYNDLDFAPSYEELFMPRSTVNDGDSSDDASTNEETEQSKSPCFSDGSVEFNVSYNKASQIRDTHVSSGVIHVADHHTVAVDVEKESVRFEPFVTVSEIGLKTNPTGIPPPSRPPPVMRSEGSNSRTTGSEGSTGGSGSSPLYFDVEVDAVREAMVKAEAILKTARNNTKPTSMKNRMVTDEGRKTLYSQGSVNYEGNDEWEEAGEFVELVRTEKPRNVNRKGTTFPLSEDFFDQKLTRRVKGGDREDHQVKLLPKHPGTKTRPIQNQQPDRMPHRKNQDHEFNWEQNARKLREALGRVNNESMELKGSGKSLGMRDESEMKLNESLKRMEEETRIKEALVKEENYRREREAFEKAENEKRTKAALEEEKKQKKLKEAREKEENERRAVEAREKAEQERIKKEQEELELRLKEKEENERRMREAREKAEHERKMRVALEQEKERKLKEAREREENERRIKEAGEKAEHERKMKEAREKEETERRIKEAREKAEHERKVRVALEKEENERRMKEAREKAELELRLKETIEQEEKQRKLKELKEENERKLKEALEQKEKEMKAKEALENERKLKEAIEQKEKEMREKKALEKEENEKKRKLKEAHEQKEKEMRAKEAREKEENEKKMKEAIELEKKEKRLIEAFEKAETDRRLREEEEIEIRLQEEAKEKEERDAIEREKTYEATNDTLEHDERRDSHESLNNVQDEEDEGCPWKVFEKNLKDASQKEVTNEPNTESASENVQAGKLNEKSKNIESIIEEEKVRDEGVGNSNGVGNNETKQERPLPSRATIQREKETERLNRERETEAERLRKIEEEREREREREKDRMAFDQKALSDARERLEKACAEARERSSLPSMETRLKAEQRAAVERATTEAHERARERMERMVSDKQFQTSSGFLNERIERSYSDMSESPQRYTSRLERHRRTADRVAKALAEKNMRDLIAQREQVERARIAETLDAEVKRWSNGKEGNIRALLSTLQYILGSESGWQPLPLTEVITSAAVKRAYRKATLCVHPDKLQQRGAKIHQKYICEKVFDLLKEAWNRFNSEEK